jgi:uncharacterized protein YodC (DUF2158 family)
MDEFKEGDVVRLKSGGPNMTVETVDDDEVRCAWFDDKNQIHRENFLLTSIRKVQQ